MGSTEEKFAALVSAQLRTDEALAQMAQAITRTSQRVEAIEENGTKK